MSKVSVNPDNFPYKRAVEMITKIRTAEVFIRNTFWDEKIFSFLHLSIGQEASAVGVALALNDKDIMLGNHRSHGHYLAKGGDLSKMIYEVFGDSRGCCKGFGGSMHMLDRNVGFTGSTPILGSIPPIAVGQSFACKQKGLENITVVFLGDGAAEEGVFMESVNLAANKSCNIIFIIEDNKYSVNSNNLDRKSEYYSHKLLFEGLGAIYIREDGQKVKSVFSATKRAIQFAKEGRPVVLHLDVTRRHAHSGPILEMTDEPYRNENDTIIDRENNDCLIGACLEAEANGFDSEEVNSWVKTEEQKICEILKDIKNTIRVRSFD